MAKQKAMGGILKVKLVRSQFGFKRDQTATVRAIGLRKINQIIEVKDSPVMRGMIFKVKHLVEIINN